MKPHLKRLLIHLLLILGVIVVIIMLSQWWLKHFTRHGESMIVPDFTGMTIPQAIKAAKAHSLQLEVLDSLFITNKPRGTVFGQIPEGGEKVKQGRRILVTINSVLPLKVKAPSLVGYSLRQAKSELVSQNFRLGTLYYEDDFATNNVLEQRLHGVPLVPGTLIDAQSVIDLVLGVDYRQDIAYVPKVIGLTYEMAKELINDHWLNVGTLFFDASVRSSADSIAAVVVRQEPEASMTVIHSMGYPVNLFLSLPPDSAVDEEPTP